MVSKEQLEYFRELFEGYLAGKLTGEEYGAFMNLVADKQYQQQLETLVSALDSKHIAEVEREEMTSIEKDNLWLDLKQQIEEKRFSGSLGSNKRGRTVAIKKLIGYAAILLMVAGGIGFFFEYKLGEQRQRATLVDNSIEVEAQLAHGSGKSISFSQNFVRLPDGSRVRLNKGASISIDTSTFDKTGARVVQLNGEAYFNVVHNSKRPFVVLTGDIETIDVGTSFNINNTEGRVQVTVIEGEVRLKNKHKELKHLIANQQLTLNTATQQVEVASLENAEAVIAWTGSSLSFENISLDSAMRIIERRFDKHILVAPAIGATKVKASFTNRDSLEDILDVLTSITGTSMEKITKDEIRINKKESL